MKRVKKPDAKSQTKWSCSIYDQRKLMAFCQYVFGIQKITIFVCNNMFANKLANWAKCKWEKEKQKKNRNEETNSISQQIDLLCHFIFLTLLAAIRFGVGRSHLLYFLCNFFYIPKRTFGRRIRTRQWNHLTLFLIWKNAGIWMACFFTSSVGVIHCAHHCRESTIATMGSRNLSQFTTNKTETHRAKDNLNSKWCDETLVTFDCLFSFFLLLLLLLVIIFTGFKL